MTETWVVRAEPVAARELRERVKAFAAAAEIPDPPLSDACLAVSEAVSNVVMHSYADFDEPGPVEVTATLVERELRLVVADNGSGMRPRPGSPGAGIGLPLIVAIAHGCEIHERDPHGTEVHLSFKLPGPA